jgi:F-box protein 18 (helicase)
MQLTPEQQSILQTTGNIKINAVAGSGKTTTVIEYARTRPSNSRILYLAFNKTVKEEAKRKFAELKNVRVETAHSLAFAHIVRQYDYKIHKGDYKTHEITEILGITGSGEKHFEYILANHISRFVAYFCNSDKKKVSELDYREVVSDAKARAFVNMSYSHLLKYTRQFLDKMNKGEIEITHDFYLKKFQLSEPALYYDYILFDEGQDASQAMLDVFLRQKATKVIVGDVHQQIYGWRYAVNSMDKVDYPVYHLSNSFRFYPDIAGLATEVLEWKKQLKEHERVKITGSGTNSKTTSKAVIARTNLGLLIKAIEYVTEKKKVKRIYFEGNINSYTYADDGASLYDVLNLFNSKRHLIRDKLIQKMKDIAELEEYIEKTGDLQLGMMVEVVKKYKNEIPGIINKIKDKHVGDGERDSAEMIFTTVHRCKGMEYDAVLLADDFINEERLSRIKKETGFEKQDKNKLSEEINLLYVAVTRAKNILYIPEELLPKGISKTSKIIPVIKKPDEAAEPNVSTKYIKRDKNHLWKTDKTKKEKAYSVEKVREKYSLAYAPWTDEMDQDLIELYADGKSITDLMIYFGRTRSAINSRLKKLRLD